MNKFNKRRANAVKERKIKARGVKKQKGTLKTFKAEVQKRGGQRTGKANKKRERQERLQEKEALREGKIDTEMQEAEAGKEQV